MKHTLICMIALALTGGGAGGYLLRAQKTDGSMVLSLKDAVQEEYLAPQDSFSRIRNTKNTLDALSLRSELGIKDALLVYSQLPKTSDEETAQAKQILDRIINAAEEAVQEFEGTTQQVPVVQSLLLALEKSERFDRWTEVYLKALHEHPTHPLIGRLASDAVRNSTLAGQQERVLGALSYISAFGPSFEGKQKIEVALKGASPCFSQIQFTHRAGGRARHGVREPLY